VLHELRHDPATAAIPIGIVSADATDVQIKRLKNAGASAYLTKPFNIPELLRTIDNSAPRPH
jgi:CheY-like chemotaxis protein